MILSGAASRWPCPWNQRHVPVAGRQPRPATEAAPARSNCADRPRLL